MVSIQSLRRSQGLTLVALALKVDIPTRTLGAIELGILPLDGDCAARLTAFFGIAPELLDTSGSTAQPAAIRLDRARTLRCTALAAALIGGLLLCQTAQPNPVQHTGRLTLSTAQRKEQHQQLGSVFSEPQPLPPARGIPRVPPLRMPNPATPPPLINQTPAIASQRHTVVLPLPPDGPFRQNVLAALTANGGALQQAVVPPSGTWSFNRAIGDPDRLELTTINGVYGGGWCDLASYYVLALRPFLPPESLVFTRHVDATGFGLQGIEDDVAVAIWNTNGGADEQDLVIHNTSGQMMVITATVVDAGVQVSAESRSAPINRGRVQ